MTTQHEDQWMAEELTTGMVDEEEEDEAWATENPEDPEVQEWRAQREAAMRRWQARPTEDRQW